MRYFIHKHKEVLFFMEDLYFEKFEGVDYKYDHRFFKFLPNKPKARHFSVLRILVYLANRQVD